MSIRKYIKNKYISCRFHPQIKNIAVLNYTPEVQYKKLWDCITMSCRGLVYDFNSEEIVARPFPKFFNFEEVDPKNIPKSKEIEIYEKYDGSLGILFYYKNQWIICTRGSFENDQTKLSTKLLEQKYNDYLRDLDKNNTYLFEIISPENKIVVNYDIEQLILLAVINTDSGNNIHIDTINWPHKAKKILNNYIYTIFDLYYFLKSQNIKNKEGYILYWPKENYRLKIKFEDYIQLHRIVFNMTNKTIWKYIKENGWGSIHNILEPVPDEYYNSIQDIISDLKSKYDDILNYCINNHKQFMFKLPMGEDPIATKKEYALKLHNSLIPKKYHKILFAMYDNKNLENMLIDLIKPLEIKHI